MDTAMVTPEHHTFIRELAQASGDYIRPFFGDPMLAVEIKGDETPVTAADRGAEELMRARIRQRFPEHGVIGEEWGAERADAEWVWVLDPIDGTHSFAAACPLFGTLIALQYRGNPVLGAIHQPILRQLVVGDGRVTTLNERPVRCRQHSNLSQATLLTSDTRMIAHHQSISGWEALCRRVALLRTWGDCYGYLLVATGWADLMCDPILNPWDIAALIPVIRGAGGEISDWQGRSPVQATSIVAAGTKALHAAALQMLAQEQEE